MNCRMQGEARRRLNKRQNLVAGVLLSGSMSYRRGMPCFRRLTLVLLTFAVASACYRLPLRIKENDATGYEDVGVPTIEAVEYTPAGRDLRVALEVPGYVTVIVVDPERGASVRFRRGELQSAYRTQGQHRLPLDRLSSPMAVAMLRRPPEASAGRGLGRVRPVTVAPRNGQFEPVTFDAGTGPRDSTFRELGLASRAVALGGGPVTSTHVVVIVTERPLDLVTVATRLARGSLDPAQIARSVADVIEGGRWMAAVAPLRGQ